MKKVVIVGLVCLSLGSVAFAGAGGKGPSVGSVSVKTSTINR